MWLKIWAWFRRDEGHLRTTRSHTTLSGKKTPPSGKSTPSRDAGTGESDDILMSISQLIGGPSDDNDDSFYPQRPVEAVKTEPIVEVVKVAEPDVFAELVEVRQNTRVASTSDVDDVVRAIKAIIKPALAKAADPIVESVQPPAVEKLPTPKPVAPTPVPAKPMRDKGGMKPEESRNEIQRTLVADDGQWPVKGLADRFKDLDDADDFDDNDGPSPFQTIMPSDD
jgi:hypothetical protein